MTKITGFDTFDVRFPTSRTARPGEAAGCRDHEPGPLARARLMRDACASYGIPLPAAALQFTRRHPAVTVAVVGAPSAEEITADTSTSPPTFRTGCGPNWRPSYMIAKGLVLQRVLNPS
jgi:hypothetical protein